MPPIRELVLAAGLSGEQQARLEAAVAPGRVRVGDDVGGADVAVTPRLGPELRRSPALAWAHAPHGLVDESAMVAALRSGHLAGAATDVVEGEPHRLGSPLWRAPNLLLTPHVTPRLEDRDERAFAVLLANVERWLADQQMLNVVGPDDVYTGPPMAGRRDRAVRYRRLARRFLCPVGPTGRQAAVGVRGCPAWIRGESRRLP